MISLQYYELHLTYASITCSINHKVPITYCANIICWTLWTIKHCISTFWNDNVTLLLWLQLQVYLYGTQNNRIAFCRYIRYKDLCLNISKQLNLWYILNLKTFKQLNKHGCNCWFMLRLNAPRLSPLLSII